MFSLALAKEPVKQNRKFRNCVRGSFQVTWGKNILPVNGVHCALGRLQRASSTGHS